MRSRMGAIIDVVLPRKVTNEYRGGPVPFYGFCLLFAAQIFSSTVHLLKADSGVNSIASIIVFPFEGPADPNNIIYMFSAIGGVSQMMFTVLYALVLWRYRSLIPLMLGLMLLGSLLGIVVTTLHPLTPEYFEYTPPGLVGRLPKLILLPTLLLMAIYRSKKEMEPSP
ncbi:MAG TPA: hypothetical protein EYG54_05375 [Myxococcales bacterium]|nr:hypothetical protein [Myxococcales bacterium]